MLPQPCRFLAEHADSLGPLAGRTMAELGLASANATLAPSAAAVVAAAVHGQPPAVAGRHRQLLCVPNGMLALEAFKRMFHSNVSALGVLGPDGRWGLHVTGPLHAGIAVACS